MSDNVKNAIVNAGIERRKNATVKVTVEVHTRDPQVNATLLGDLAYIGWGKPVRSCDISWSMTDNGRTYDFRAPYKRTVPNGAGRRVNVVVPEKEPRS